MKIAVIGSGISGLGAAYILDHQHDVVIYEKNPTLGGHSRTINVSIDDHTVPVDTGFIVFNKKNYPLLTGMFEHLHVPIQKSDMSFGVSINNGWLEYASKALFAQWSNLWRQPFCRMMRDVLRFNRQAIKYLDAAPNVTLGQCLDEMKMGPWFRKYYLQAMGAAIWSCSVNDILSYPASTFIRFFENHGLLTVNKHPQWYTVTGGSREYIKRITEKFSGAIRLNTGVKSIIRQNDHVIVTDTNGKSEEFDHVILACHADQALRLLAEPSDDDKKILGAFGFQDNHVAVHSDMTFMPKRRKCWASWVYLSDTRDDTRGVVSLSYWMNQLQNLVTSKPVIVTLNPGHDPDPEMVYDRHTFSHPVFTPETLAAQGQMDKIQGQGNVWYCGAWQRYGFHEDGLLSAVNVCKKLGVTPPWQ